VINYRRAAAARRLIVALPMLRQVLARRLRLAGDFDFKLIAQRTPGFVGADLQALTKEAAAVAIKRIFSQLGAVPPPVAAVGDLMDAEAVRSRQDALSQALCVTTSAVRWRSS